MALQFVKKLPNFIRIENNLHRFEKILKTYLIAKEFYFVSEFVEC